MEEIRGQSGDIGKDPEADLSVFSRHGVAIDPSVANRLGLSCHKLELLCLLVKHPLCSWEQLVDWMYGHRADGGPADPQKNIEVYACSLRKALAPYRVQIRVLYGEGYYIEATIKPKLRALLAGEIQ